MQKSKLLTSVAQCRKHPALHQRIVLGSSTVPDALAEFLCPDYSLAVVKPHVLVLNGLPQNSKWKCRVVKRRAMKHNTRSASLNQQWIALLWKSKQGNKQTNNNKIYHCVDFSLCLEQIATSTTTYLWHPSKYPREQGNKNSQRN